jgi:hypothetical protein
MNNTYNSPSNNLPSNNSFGSPIGSSFSSSASTSSYSNPLGSTSTGESFFSSISWTTWMIILLVLAFLGFNIFVYLAKGTQVFAEMSAYFASILGTGAAETTKQVVNVSATGTKAATDIAAGTVTTGINVAQETASQIKNANYSQQQQLNTSLNTAKTEQKAKANEEEQDNPGYTADEASSSIQSSKTAGKAGWCYIGEDRGFRSCIKVGENDQCMSGDIFPSQEICMYPELRP